MIKKVALLVVMALVFCAAGVMADDFAQEKAAIDAAQSWLAFIDKEDYAKSWQETSSLFKTAVSEDQMKQAIHSARKPLGKLISRELKNAVYTTSIPGGPDGEYVVIEFQTSFKNKKSATETVTPMLDRDGVWRVSGYFIR